MIIIDTVIELLEPGEAPVEVYATVKSAGQSEFVAAGQNGFKAALVFEVWAEEYEGQQELLHGGRRLTVYRTYGPRPDDKMELYTERRVGKKHGDSG